MLQESYVYLQFSELIMVHIQFLLSCTYSSQVSWLRLDFADDGDNEVAKEDDTYDCLGFLTLVQLLKLSKHYDCYDWLR